MTRVLVATRSAGKQAEFRSLLAVPGVSIVFLDEFGLFESHLEHDLERFDTFFENARAKAAWFARLSGLPTLGDDSGLEVDALNGLPGVRSRRFAGAVGVDSVVSAANNQALLERLRGVPLAGRRARFRCVLVLVDPDGREEVTEGTTPGRILDAPRGSGGFGYDPLFFSEALGQTFGEASADAKHRVSHRGRAARAMREILRMT